MHTEYDYSGVTSGKALEIPSTLQVTPRPASTCSVHRVCLVDDVLGDGSSLVEFVRAYEVCLEDGALTSTLLGDFTDETLSTDYAVAGAAVAPNEIGSAAEIKQDSTELTGPTFWGPSAMTLSYTIRAVTGGVQYTGSNGQTRTLAEGEVVDFARDTEVVLDDAPVLGIASGEKAVVTHTYLGVA